MDNVIPTNVGVPSHSCLDMFVCLSPVTNTEVYRSAVRCMYTLVILRKHFSANLFFTFIITDCAVSTHNFGFNLPVEDVAVIWINKAICCLSDMGVFELGRAGVTPVVNPIPFGLGGGIIP